jgi:hypothetical protein
MPSDISSLLRLFLPDFILENFEFTGVIEDSDIFHIHLEEFKTPPLDWGPVKLLSKGFFPEISVQDFPIRGHKVFLHIKRRRWINTETGMLMYRNWTLVEKGTRMTGEFAAFLKEINRYSTE